VETAQQDWCMSEAAHKLALMGRLSSLNEVSARMALWYSDMGQLVLTVTTCVPMPEPSLGRTERLRSAYATVDVVTDQNVIGSDVQTF
jgi:hypothetical protein